MRIQNIWPVSLFVLLYGCQPGAPAPKTAAPAPAAAPAPMEPASSAPAAQMSAAPAAKAESAPAAAEGKPEAKPGPELSEAEGMQLAKSKNCLACHALDKKMVGPSFRDVAAKYRGDATAEAKLAEKIAKGGSGVWGTTVMPPSPQVSEPDRKALARFVLSLK